MIKCTCECNFFRPGDESETHFRQLRKIESLSVHNLSHCERFGGSAGPQIYLPVLNFCTDLARPHRKPHAASRTRISRSRTRLLAIYVNRKKSGRGRLRVLAAKQQKNCSDPAAKQVLAAKHKTLINTSRSALGVPPMPILLKNADKTKL